MNSIKRCLVIFVGLLCISSMMGDMYVSPTKYDYSNLANSIVKNSRSKSEKARAIYDWVCTNIRYDTSYSIYTADECYEQRKGVCQAYSELYYRLCEAVGVKCTIITGISKNALEGVSRAGHAWILVEVENRKILMDPTWGAGYVNGSVFTFRKDHSYWYDVDPHWMIFTHFPQEAQYQLLANPIDEVTFCRLPALDPDCKYLGWNGKLMLQMHLSDKITSLPTLYLDGDPGLVMYNIPMQRTLNPATVYRFEIGNHTGRDMAIIAGSQWYKSSQFKRVGDKYSIDVMPGEGGRLLISVEGKDGQYHTIVSYDVTYPTSQEAQYIESKRPPYVYDVDFASVELVDMPKYRNLHLNTKYRFCVRDVANQSFAILLNNTWFMKDKWQKSGDQYWIDIAPNECGKLVFMVKGKNGSYYHMVEYKVVR